MQILIIISNLMVPAVILIIVVYGMLKKISVYDSFLDGAKDGMKTVAKILPTLIGLMVAIGMLRVSGTLDLITGLAEPLTSRIGYPKEALSLTLMRLVSSSAATGLLIDLFKQYSPDSFLGRFVSIMMSSTETVFYTMSIYFMSVKITKTRYTLTGALIANLAGVIAALYITEVLFG